MTIEPKIFTEVKEILKGFGQTYLTEDGALKRSKLTEDLDNYVPLLMKELLSSEIVRQSYVEEIKVGDKTHEIFKLNQFVELFTYKQYWEDSYTKFSNKIGLTAGGKFIDETADVVLDFPFKDCVLKAGMSKEDAKDSDEAFLNEVIAKTEIDTLLEPKIFVNATRYDKEHLVGQPTDTFSEQDNLIIKGNNLIALHSIKARYAGKVKCIYIDPPYNTGNDSFNYNDNFNHSAWLTFMKNRLEIARELLSDDGSIFINIDDDEGHYLKVIADSVFGRDNFINTIIWKKKYAPQNDAKYFSDMHDFILVYSKNKDNFAINGLDRTESMDDKYKNPDNDERGPWQSDNFSVKTFSESGNYTIITPVGRKVEPPNGRVWITSKERYEEMLADNRIWFGKDGKGVPRVKRFLSEVRKKVTPQTIWDYTEVGHNQDARREIIGLSLEKADFSTPKPERLLQRVITLSTNENDIVLDFFMGSATTQSVAMKMKRRFIGIEQMDYIKTVSVERLKKVIDGEQGGVSKAVNWQGGGSFVYAELFEKNQGYLKDLLSSSDTTELNAVYHRMVNDGADFDFRVDLKKFEYEKSELNFEKQKEFLLKTIDKNQLYYQYSEIEDEDVREMIADGDLRFNKGFYGE
ncbi:site-specific DNA-methyltransferase [Lactococcus formosensis]|uniref:site-specific DNA-methyltransferase n=1 Tax=Lactococcus formosensis TaxID=1281486 RepID=UPI0024350C85|nr:site-specific DNA-methyltransferase [Lactococcus formosensis]MDG6119198.1 site-specific DNA-methyltransferase [Lactococcus formosensis]